MFESTTNRTKLHNRRQEILPVYLVEYVRTISDFVSKLSPPTKVFSYKIDRPSEAFPTTLSSTWGSYIISWWTELLYSYERPVCEVVCGR